MYRKQEGMYLLALLSDDFQDLKPQRNSHPKCMLTKLHTNTQYHVLSFPWSIQSRKKKIFLMKTHNIFTKIPKLNCTFFNWKYSSLILKITLCSLNSSDQVFQSLISYKSHGTSAAFRFASVTSVILASPLLTLSLIQIFLCLFIWSDSNGIQVRPMLQLGNTDRHLLMLPV